MRHFVHDSKAQVDSDGQLAVTSPRNGEMQHRKSVLNFLTKRNFLLFEKKVGGGTQGTSGKMLMNFDGGKKKGEVGVPLLNEADKENKSRETVGAS